MEVIAEVLIPTTELVVLAETPTKEANHQKKLI